MRSPFPGMDPYIEAFGLWADFHTKLIAEIERTLAASVPDGYVIRTPFRSYVMLTPSDPTEKHSMEPDVSIAESEDRRRRRPRRTGTALVEKSPGEAVGMTMGDFISTQEREPYIEIYQTRPKRKLVTGIEILSPSNKRFKSEGWSQYLRKRRGFMKGIANFVEIDLLRGGERMPMKDRWPDSPYYVLVSRKEKSPLCSVWPAYCTKPLQPIPVPLAPADQDVLLEIQPLVNAVYMRSQYDGDIDYSRPLDPPLRADEKVFVKRWHNGRSSRK